MKESVQDLKEVPSPKLAESQMDLERAFQDKVKPSDTYGPNFVGKEGGIFDEWCVVCCRELNNKTILCLHSGDLNSQNGSK